MILLASHLTRQMCRLLYSNSTVCGRLPQDEKYNLIQFFFKCIYFPYLYQLPLIVQTLDCFKLCSSPANASAMRERASAKHKKHEKWTEGRMKTFELKKVILYGALYCAEE